MSADLVAATVKEFMADREVGQVGQAQEFLQFLQVS
jgi:hypothetical protein